jgi:acetyltransferase
MPLIRHRHAASEEEALASAEMLGYPLVMKTAQPEVLHKSDAGGVELDLADEPAVREAYRRLLAMGPEVLLQRMADPGLEWFVGGRQDRSFGPIVVTGPGGIYVEVLGETAVRVGPLCEEGARGMLDELKGASLLSGSRGRAVLHREGLADLLTRVSWLLADFPEVRELDLNPVRVYENTCVVLDWRATLSR